MVRDTKPLGLDPKGSGSAPTAPVVRELAPVNVRQKRANPFRSCAPTTLPVKRLRSRCLPRPMRRPCWLSVRAGSTLPCARVACPMFGWDAMCGSCAATLRASWRITTRTAWRSGDRRRVIDRCSGCGRAGASAGRRLGLSVLDGAQRMRAAPSDVFVGVGARDEHEAEPPLERSEIADAGPLKTLALALGGDARRRPRRESLDLLLPDRRVDRHLQKTTHPNASSTTSASPGGSSSPRVAAATLAARPLRE